MIGDGDVVGDGEPFAAQAGVDAEGGEAGFVEEFAQGVAQGLAALAEGGGDDAAEERFVVGLGAVCRQRHQAHDAGGDLGFRAEGAGRHVEQAHHGEALLQHDGQAAVIGGVRFGDHAHDHFFLKHEVHVAHAVGEAGKMEQQRRGNVVRQVADHAQRGAECGEIKLQRVAFVDGELFGRVVLLEVGDEVAVDLDDVEMTETLDEGLRHRAEAGADLDHGLALLRADGLNDIADGVGVGKKVLTEALARAMPCLHAGRPCSWAAISSASSTAAKRLPGSAVPCPARSSAVP